jgi:hypothetical protein
MNESTRRIPHTLFYALLSSQCPLRTIACCGRPLSTCHGQIAFFGFRKEYDLQGAGGKTLALRIYPITRGKALYPKKQQKPDRKTKTVAGKYLPASPVALKDTHRRRDEEEERKMYSIT